MRVLVVGAGPAGLTAALVLRRAGRSVRIVEEAPRLRDEGFTVPVQEPGLSVLRRLGVPGSAEMPRGELVRGLAREVGAVEFGVSAQDMADRFGDFDVVLGADGVDSPTRGIIGLPEGRHGLGYSLALHRDAPMEIVPAGQVPSGDPWRVDEITQIRLPRWSAGNVMLIGDAAAACGAGTGFSTTVALFMAHEVASGLLAGRSLPELEAQLRPWVTERQAAAARLLTA